MLDDDSDLSLGGLTVEQFAGVTAAIADGIGLDEVLAQERIGEEAWVPAQRMWRLAIAQSPDLQLRYVDARAAAEDCLARPIEPLDADPSAWMGFLGALAAVGSKEVLATYGLSMADLARLGRAWKRRQLADPALSAELERLGPLAARPARVEVGALRLRRFPWSPRDEPGAGADAARAGEGALVAIELPSAPAVQRATFQLGHDVTPAPLFDADETLPIPTAGSTGPALPFAGATSLDRLRWLCEAPGGPALDATANPDETLPIPRSAPPARTGTFRDGFGPLEIPVLSLSEYVELRAHLLVRGEDDAATLARFGVSSRPVHAALKARFAQYFAATPLARAEFADALADRVAALRARR